MLLEACWKLYFWFVSYSQHQLAGLIALQVARPSIVQRTMDPTIAAPLDPEGVCMQGMYNVS